jgi:hypothetical protein
MTTIDEIENNLNFTWDKSHNLFKFNVGKMSYAEAIVTHRLLMKQKKSVQAGILAELFFRQYEMALIQDMSMKLVMKEMFNTLKVIVKQMVKKK